MKITQALWRQHLGRMMKFQWWNAGRRVVRDNPLIGALASKGIKIVDASEVIAPPRLPRQNIVFEPIIPQPLPLDETHPDWHEKPCLKYGDNSLILEGTEQAQVLLNTHHVRDALPDSVNALVEEPSKETQKLIKRFIYSTHIFDAHQEKLPKKKDPLRPAWNFPRFYGLTETRKMHNLVQKFLQLCELISDPMIVHQRKIMNDTQVRTFIERDNDILYFESTFDTMMTSSKLLTPMSSANEKFDSPFPIMYPLLPTISLMPVNLYNLQDHYPVTTESRWMNPHTIFINHDSQLVKNITELPVTESQLVARSMLKSFATAASCAKQKFGEGVMDLPEPVTIQCVQSNGQWFYFSVFQLNTLNIGGDQGTKNVWWSLPRVNLYEKAEYVDGIPTLEGYNPEVFKRILAFYKNV